VEFARAAVHRHEVSSQTDRERRRRCSGSSSTNAKFCLSEPHTRRASIFKRQISAPIGSARNSKNLLALGEKVEECAFYAAF